MSLWKNSSCKIRRKRGRVVSSGFECRSGRPLAGSFAVVPSWNPGPKPTGFVLLFGFFNSCYAVFGLFVSNYSAGNWNQLDKLSALSNNIFYSSFLYNKVFVRTENNNTKSRLTTICDVGERVWRHCPLAFQPHFPRARNGQPLRSKFFQLSSSN